MNKLGTQHKNRINVLDLRDSPWVDGPGRTILDCASSLEGPKFHFIIGAFSGGVQNTNAYAQEAKLRGLKVEAIPERSSFDWAVIGHIVDLIKQHEIDIIHTHDFRSNFFGLICAKRCGLPAVTTVHGWISNDFKGKFYTFIDKVLLRYFDHIVAVSERTRRKVTKFLVPVRKTTVITNALVLDYFKPDPTDKSFRHEFGIAEDAIVIANIGRLSPEKGQFEFLVASSELLKRFKNLKFVLVGVGPDEQRLRAFVKEHHIENYVVFAGYRKDMVRIYNSLDLAVQSSYTEGMPNIVLESLLMTVPVIATNVGGTDEIVDHNVNGVLIHPGRIDEIVTEIARFLKSRHQFKEMALAGRKKIIDQFDHAKRVRKFEYLYETLTST